VLITMARKPSDAVIRTALGHGTGPLNIDACRIAGLVESRLVAASESRGVALAGSVDGGLRKEFFYDGSKGRWPANVMRDTSTLVESRFPDSKGSLNGGSPDRNSTNSIEYWGEGGGGFKGGRSVVAHGDTGTAARFFKRIG
jgi:hypothetical protein